MQSPADAVRSAVAARAHHWTHTPVLVYSHYINSHYINFEILVVLETARQLYRPPERLLYRPPVRRLTLRHFWREGSIDFGL